MSMKRLPKDSATFARRAFETKATWHARMAAMSLGRKLVVLDRLREARKQLPRPQQAGVQPPSGVQPSPGRAASRQRP